MTDESIEYLAAAQRFLEAGKALKRADEERNAALSRWREAGVAFHAAGEAYEGRVDDADAEDPELRRQVLAVLSQIDQLQAHFEQPN
jgi:hypothetical protein